MPEDSCKFRCQEACCNLTYGFFVPFNHPFATAKLVNVEGRKLVFEVTAKDAVELISKGIHTRFLVDAEPFTSRANKKLDQ